MNSKLKPCPFCGSEDLLEDMNSSRFLVILYFNSSVRCKGCGAEIRSENQTLPIAAQQQARDKWNRRRDGL